MKEKFAIYPQCKLLSISQGLTGKMSGMPAITSSMLCNEHCQKLSAITGSVCEKCYTKKYLLSRPNTEHCYRENSNLLSSSIIPKNQIPFINAAFCRLETFGDIINVTHLQNYINIIKKNPHCVFSLFTKNYATVFNYFQTHKQPSNLSIVISSLMLNNPFNIAENLSLPLKNLKIFTVYTKQYAEKNGVVINCGKSRCIDCKRCYTKNKNPIYISELLK
ncbi:MAG: hypothetical protein J6C23_05730 [Clostridia bacterium]|nr:hypothetical protein [Clostridia bacterium]